jgi:hypothetical protein
MSRAFDAGAQTAPATISTLSPDPPPLAEREQWMLDLRWDRGEIWLLAAGQTVMASPRETARAMGRFALELYEGPTLVERVRFDFPLLGVDSADRGEGAPSLSRRLRTRVGVLFPATHRGNRLELWDRGDNRRWSIPWPLPGPLASRPDLERDAGSDASLKRL